MSANTIVTTLRDSPAGSATAVSAAPQFKQNFARSGFSSPQAGQRIPCIVRGGSPLIDGRS